MCLVKLKWDYTKQPNICTIFKEECHIIYAEMFLPQMCAINMSQAERFFSQIRVLLSIYSIFYPLSLMIWKWNIYSTKTFLKLWSN